MADAYETKIKVSADTSDAQRKLSDLGNQKIKPVEVTVAINDADVKAKLARIAAENKIKVSPAGVSEKDGEKFRIEFIPDDKKVKAALREVTASEHTVIVGMRAKWDTAQSLYAELQKPVQAAVSKAVEQTVERIPAAASGGGSSNLPPPPSPPSLPPAASEPPRKSAEGARKLVEAMNDAGNAAERAGKKQKAAFDQATGSVNKAYYALRSIQRLAVGMGLATAIVHVVNSLRNLVDSFKAADEQKKKLFDIQVAHAHERQIAALSGEYNALADAIRSAADEQKHLLALIDDEVAARRKNERADIGEAERRAIAALDPNSPTYAQEAERIRSRFSQMRGAKDAGDQVEDLVLQRQKMGADATAAEGEASAQDAKTKEIKARIAKAVRERGAAEIKAIEQNNEDKNGFVDSWGKNVKQIFSLDWGRLGTDATAAGDAVRREGAKEAAQKDLEVQKLEEELRKSEHAASELRKKAARIRERADAMGGLIEAAQKNANTVGAANASATPTADALRDASDRRNAGKLEADLARAANRAQWERDYDAAKYPQKLEMLAESRRMAEQELADRRKKYADELDKPAADRSDAVLKQLESQIRSAAALVETRTSQQQSVAMSGVSRMEGGMQSAYAMGQVSGNRLTAMGLGSGVRGTDSLATDMHKMLDLMREQIKATKDNKPTPGDDTATFSE